MTDDAVDTIPVTRRYRFPEADCSRIPFGMYHDRDVYALEQERVFRGPVWNYLALECEIPSPGDFRTVTVGDTPVIVNRTKDGRVAAFVNRCAHKGAIVQRHVHGNTKVHICCYHQWSYDLEGGLIGVPFRRGANGHGGLPENFDTACHGLATLRIETLSGVIFGTFAKETRPLAEFLDTLFVEQITRLFHEPVKVLGYQRQRVFGNWKLYAENLRDPNHGGLLHMFQVAFGIARLSQKGGARMDCEHKHNMSWAAQGGRIDGPAQGYGETQRGDMDIKLRDPSLLQYRKEYPDDQTLSILSIFPNAAFQQISNTLAVRQFRTSSADEFEIVSTFFGYADEEATMTRHRLRQANLAGPAGLVSMEDGEAVELVHRASAGVTDEYAVVEFGGRGAIEDQETLITDVPVRGFWQHYCRLMGIAPGANA